jgi:hypothetical protein
MFHLQVFSPHSGCTPPNIISNFSDIDYLDGSEEVSAVVMGFSSQFAHRMQLIWKDVPKEASCLFNVMLFSTSASYIYQDRVKCINGLSLAEIQQLGAIAGHKCLQYLDQELKTEGLRACFEKRMCLFIMVYGTMIAIRCTEVARVHANIKMTQDHKLWVDMCHHLFEVLAHYFVLLGRSIGKVSTMTVGDVISMF